MKNTIYLAIATATLGAIIALPAQANEDAFKKAGCVACHTKDKKMVGPALQDIAKKYKGQADAVAKLSDKVRKGGKDVWGPIPMPPNGADKINDGDLKAVVEWILEELSMRRSVASAALYLLPVLPALAAPPEELVRLVRQDCGSCHGMTLQGGLGTPLTPAALRGKPADSLVATIIHGRPGTAMPAWKSLLSESDAQWIVARLIDGFPEERR